MWGICGTDFRLCQFLSELLVFTFFSPALFIFFFITSRVPLLEDNYVSFQKQICFLLGVVILSFHKFIEFSWCNLVLAHFFLSFPLKGCLLGDYLLLKMFSFWAKRLQSLFLFCFLVMNGKYPGSTFCLIKGMNCFCNLSNRQSVSFKVLFIHFSVWFEHAQCRPVFSISNEKKWLCCLFCNFNFFLRILCVCVCNVFNLEN